MGVVQEIPRQYSADLVTLPGISGLSKPVVQTILDQPRAFDSREDWKLLVGHFRFYCVALTTLRTISDLLAKYLL